jgi:hypothetical protein
MFVLVQLENGCGLSLIFSINIFKKFYFFRSETLKKCIQCPIDWILISEHCYYANKDQLSWKDADDYCKNEGAYLIKIDDDQEYDLLVDYLNGQEGKFWVRIR